MNLHLVHPLVCAVQDNHFTAFQLVYHQTTHIGVVGQEGLGVCKHEFLVDNPCLWHVLIELIQHPHAVVFHDDSLHSMLFLQTL